MAKGVLYQNDYIVGGPAACQITPNFALSEFASSDGKVYIHRELVAALQVLRDSLGRSIKIVSLTPNDGLGDGLQGKFIWIESGVAEDTARIAGQLVKDGWLSRVEVRGKRVYLEMPDPAKLPPVLAEKALDLAIVVTAAFETSGDPYQQVTGNFDGAGLSFGPLQVNFKTGTLQELFRRFTHRDAATLMACFGPLWNEWQEVLKLGTAKQVAWADAHSLGPHKADFAPAWKEALQKVGRTPAFRQETLRYAYDTYGRKLIVALAWLKGVRPIPITNLRCLAALFDLCVQQGSLDKAHTEIRKRIDREDPQNEFALTRIAVEERGRKALEAWRSDCISRRLCILDRQPVKVSEAGKTSERDNPKLYLLRNAKVSKMESYLA